MDFNIELTASMKQLTLSLNRQQIGRKKNGTSLNILDLSQEVNWLGLEPRTHTLKVYCSTN